MRTNRTKLFTIIFFAVAALLATFLKSTPAMVASFTIDPAAVFKAKCAMCYTPKATKFFDPSKPEAEHVQTIMKGKKTEKPPFMPAFETKGITEDDAKALSAYMKNLTAPADCPSEY